MACPSRSEHSNATGGQVFSLPIVLKAVVLGVMLLMSLNLAFAQDTEAAHPFRFEVQLAKFNPKLNQALLSFSYNRTGKEKVILFLSNEGNSLLINGRKAFVEFEADTLLNDTLFLSLSPNPRFEDGGNGVEISYAVGQEQKVKKKERTVQFTVENLKKRPLIAAVWLQYYIGKDYGQEEKRMFIFPVR